MINLNANLGSDKNLLGHVMVRFGIARCKNNDEILGN